MTEPNGVQPAAQRVSWRQLLAYGAGGIIPIALFNIAGQLMALLANISLGLSAALLGAVMMVPRLWDAVSDPVMGHITDNTRTRWGRRRPYLLFGGIAVALTFVAMWWVPRGEAVQAWFGSETAYSWFQLMFVLAAMLIFYTACTTFEIPHGALGMELSEDYHDRTRLFSAKSFLGNLFAMGTPWLIGIASLELFCGPGGDLVDGMRYVSIAIAAMLIPLSYWWFLALSEPGFAVASQQEKAPFWASMRTACSNKTFLLLIAIVFTLAMGFNFVNSFGNYIKIFYLYEGDVPTASILLGIDGTVWAVTSLVAVFPLNMLSQKWGKNFTLLLAIVLMCLAQLAKIICYDPQHPYLVLIPTVLLSSGMLMFFTLGASMVGDICDLDELQTGTRSEGAYYSVYWWFIKMGTAVASLVMGILLVSTNFDEKQNVAVDSLRGSLEVLHAQAESWTKLESADADRATTFHRQLQEAIDAARGLEDHFSNRTVDLSEDVQHKNELLNCLRTVSGDIALLKFQAAELIASPQQLMTNAAAILQDSKRLKRQSPSTLYRLRFIEIGLPLLLSAVSIWLTVGYPLTESRCHEISAALKKRRAED